MNSLNKIMEKEKKIFKNVPEYLKWNNTIFHFERNKGKCLVYKCEGEYKHEDWIEDAEVIVVEHRKERKPYDQFYVLFHMTSSYHNPDIDLECMKGVSRLAKEWKPKDIKKEVKD